MNLVYFLQLKKKKITKIALYQRYIFLPTFLNEVVFLIFNEYFSLSTSDYPHLIYISRKKEKNVNLQHPYLENEINILGQLLFQEEN